MGAQTTDRLVQFQKRFVEWDDPTGSTPAYHYGTHYSSAMIVASYLVRMEPFTQVFLRLQVILPSFSPLLQFNVCFCSSGWSF